LKIFFGWKHIKPPKKCSHKYNFLALSLFGKHHILGFFSCFKYIWLDLDLD
jgi:hypothetical protein